MTVKPIGKATTKKERFNLSAGVPLGSLTSSVEMLAMGSPSKPSATSGLGASIARMAGTLIRQSRVTVMFKAEPMESSVLMAPILVPSSAPRISIN